MTVLFIGNFLSRSKGTLNPSEKIGALLQKENIGVLMASAYTNKVIRLLDIIRSILFSRFDIGHVDVFSGQAFTIASVAARLIKWRGKPLILNLHGGALPEYYPKAKDRVRAAFLMADQLCTPSMYLKNYFEKEGFDIQYLPNFIELEQFPYTPHQVPSEPLKLLWVRAFIHIYNPKLPIEMVRILAEKGHSIQLTMVGPDKGMMAECKALISRYHLEKHITITGKIPNHELSRYYQDSDLFINTTSYESFGVCVLEAAASGLPVISSRVGEIPYLWEDGQTILLTDAISSEAFAEKVEQVIKQPDMLKTIAQHAFERSQAFSWANLKPQWLSLLKTSA